MNVGKLYRSEVYFYMMPFVALLLTSCTKISASAKQDQQTAMPTQAIEKFVVKETSGAKPNWILEAASAEINDVQKMAYLVSPNVKFYEKGEYSSTLVADTGRINMETYDIWGDKNCIITTTKGERLETKNLKYLSSTKKIVTDDNVLLLREKEKITGTGMEATPDLSSIIIKKQKVEMRQ